MLVTGYRFGEFTLDLERGVLLRDGQDIPLRPKSFETLHYLVQNAGKLVSREELLAAVWPDVMVTEGSITQCLIDVRGALGDDDRAMVRTVPRRGLIFEPGVEPITHASPAEAYLRKAVELDSGFAEAWELLSLAYWTEPGPLREPAQTLALIREAAARALALEPDRDCARALYAEGSIGEQALADAIDAYVATANRQPNNPAVLRPLTWHLIISGYLEEGVRAAERWVAIDPLSSMAHMRYSAALVSVQRRAEAAAELEAAHRLSGGGTTWYLGEAALQRGEYDSAAEHFENALVAWGQADVGWIRPLLSGARDPQTGAAFLDREIPTIVAPMPP